MSKREFEYKDKKSSKFWHITLEGNKYTVNFGRIGTKGQTQEKTFPSVDNAKTIYERTIKQKLKKGYVEITKKAGEGKSQKREPKIFPPKKEQLLNELKSDKPAVRAKGAWYLGDKKYLSSDILEGLLHSLKDKEAIVRYSSLYSLGILCENENPGESEKIITAVKELKKDTLPHISRMASEALRKIGLKEDLKKEALETFPSALKELLEEEKEEFILKFKAFLPAQKNGNLLEALYEVNNSTARKTLKEMLFTVDTGRYWNNIKSIYKRAEYRLDAEIFGIIACRIEKEKAQGIIYDYGSWFQYDNTNIKNIKGFIKDEEKKAFIDTLPLEKMISREEITKMLLEKDFDEFEIRDCLRHSLYYGNNYKLDKETVENLKKSTKIAAELAKKEQIMSQDEFSKTLKSLKLDNEQVNILQKFFSKGYDSGNWCCIQGWSANSVSYYVPKAKAELFKTLPKYKLMSKEEMTSALKELDFNENEVQRAMNCVRYYGNLYEATQKSVKQLEDIVNNETINAVAEKCTKMMSQKEFDDLLKNFKFNNEEREMVIKIASKGYVRHKSNNVKRFVRETKSYLMRRLWRYLKKIAQKYPHLYAKVASSFLIHFKDEDGRPVEKKITYRYDWQTRRGRTITKYYDKFTHLWAFNHILFGNSKRYFCNKKTYNWYCGDNYTPGDLPASEIREEAFPELWEKDFEALFNLLLKSECYEVSSFAIKVLNDKFAKELTASLSTGSIKKLLKKPYPFVVETILKSLKTTFDRQNPHMELIKLLLDCPHRSARRLAHEWIKLIIEEMSEKKKFISGLLRSSYSDNRELSLELISLLSKKDINLKKDFLSLLISILITAEKIEGLHSIIIKTLKDNFSKELKNLPAEEIFTILNSPSKTVQDLGGWLLMEGQIEPADLESHVITGFATHEVMTIRKAGRKMMEDTKERWKDEMFRVLSLLESNWDDTRDFAFKFLEDNYSLEDFTPGIILNLCDSINKTVQDFGKKMLSRHITSGRDFDFVKLTEHPDMNIQDFVLDLVIEKLPLEVEKVKKVIPYFRRILFHVNRGRKMKDRVLIYLEKIGLSHAFIAAEITGLLEDYSGVMTQGDFSACLVIMSKFKEKYPYIKCPVEILSS